MEICPLTYKPKTEGYDANMRHNLTAIDCSESCEDKYKILKKSADECKNTRVFS